VASSQRSRASQLAHLARLARLTAAPALLAAVALTAVPACAAAKSPIVVRHERVTYGSQTSQVTIVSMPRPGRGRTLMPVLPGDIVSAGLATTSSVSKRLSRYGTAVAINADLFEYASGQPSGLLLIDGEIYNQPQGGRPALAVDRDGVLSTSKPKATGVLTLPGGHQVDFDVNVRQGGDDAVLYDGGWGPSAPSGASSSLIGRITDGAVARKDGTWRARATLDVAKTRAGSLPIPSDDGPDLLFQASGKPARTLARAKRGQSVDMRYKLGPLAADADFAIGGGPILIRGGKVIYSRSSNREFSEGQLVPPDARTAVAQLKNGRILFYAADKGGGSTGLTIEEVARDLKRRGAVTAMAFDSGGSTSVSLNGRLLNAPSDGVERPVGNVLTYFIGRKDTANQIGGVAVGRRAAGARVPALSYTMVRPAKISITLTDPQGRVYPIFERRVRAGEHAIRLPATLPVRTGKWRVDVTADDLRDRVHRTFVVGAKAKPAVTKPTEQPVGSGAAFDDQAAKQSAATVPQSSQGTDRGTATDGSTSPVWWIAAGVVLLVLVAGALVAWRRRRTPAAR
jgi:hypothetical protein